MADDNLLMDRSKGRQEGIQSGYPSQVIHTGEVSAAVECDDTAAPIGDMDYGK
jgi:hypothetical protein